jgi:hypothetical protein
MDKSQRAARITLKSKRIGASSPCVPTSGLPIRPRPGLTKVGYFLVSLTRAKD